MRCHLPDTVVADGVSQLQQELTAICAAVPHRRDGLRFYVQSVKNRQTPQAVIFKKINTPNPIIKIIKPIIRSFITQFTTTWINIIIWFITMSY